MDDIIEITDVNSNAGELTGVGYSSYVKDKQYSLRSRTSNKSVAQIYYSSPDTHTGLSGIVILNCPPIGNINGWWIGAGRHREDTGGGVSLEKHSETPAFELKNYKVD